MLHKPADNSAADPASAYKTRLGLWMFAIYCLVFAGFVFTNVLTEGRAMEVLVGGGLNLAVVYGLALIVIALIQALIYNHMCTAKEASLKGSSRRN